jgi:hypothetical protein
MEVHGAPFLVQKEVVNTAVYAVNADLTLTFLHLSCPRFVCAHGALRGVILRGGKNELTPSSFYRKSWTRASEFDLFKKRSVTPQSTRWTRTNCPKDLNTWDLGFGIGILDFLPSGNKERTSKLSRQNDRDGRCCAQGGTRTLTAAMATWPSTMRVYQIPPPGRGAPVSKNAGQS